ncbi:hypothetical protein BaRGS_00003758, partial [Batillaria attramentaria]
STTTMEAPRLLSQLLVVACCLVLALGRMASSMEESDDVDIQGSLFTQDDGVKRSDQDISKLLLKHLRFRGLPEPAETSDEAEFARNARNQVTDQVSKRQRQRMLVSNLAALLSGLKDRQVEPNMRMPSLRFGK